MWRKPSRRGVSDAARGDIERRKFLDRLIEADVIETIEAADGEAGDASEPSDDKQRAKVTVDDIADEWRAFDRNRNALTMSKRLAEDYARRSRHFAILASLGAIVLAGATAAFVWASWGIGSQRSQVAAREAVTVASETPKAAGLTTSSPNAAGSDATRTDGDLAPVTLSLIVDRSTAAEVAFPLELKPDDRLGVASFLLIRGVPSGATVSYAQPLSPSVWVMPASALGLAKLAISPVAPRDFTLAIDALSADGIRYAAFVLNIASE